MEDSAAKDQSSASGRSTSRLLRYPLRSAGKLKEEKPSLTDSSNPNSAAKRVRVPSSVSQSISVLDLSGKDKSAKPPRRLSGPSKSNITPAPKSYGNTTPISDTRPKRPAVNLGKIDTPVSDVSKSSTRKKFSVLSSASYWLSQIKLSESAAKHSISLGFFKLALEAGCEPIQRMSDELKSYVRRHVLSEFDESIKKLFESYKISENLVSSQFSGNCSEAASEINPLSDDDVKSNSSSITDAEKANLETPDMKVDETQQVKNANIETHEKDDSVKTIKKSVPKKAAASSKSGSEVKGRGGVQKKLQNPVKKESARVNEKVKKPALEEGDCSEPLKSATDGIALEENKENKIVSQMAEVETTEI